VNNEDTSDKKTDNASQTFPRLAYTMQETAEILGVSYITVHRLLKRGLLKSCSALRHKLIPMTEIERFLRDTMGK
jgi:excisionase family DNA binding protein